VAAIQVPGKDSVQITQDLGHMPEPLRQTEPPAEPAGTRPAPKQELHLRFHGVSAEDVAAILADVNRQDR
jgi:hypothetical protein